MFIWQYPATVDRVIDGDTIVCHVQFSVEEERHGVNVRIEGINAIELREQFGAEARDFAAQLVAPGTPLVLIHHRREKFGRFLAKAILPDGSDFGTHMLTALASDGVTHLAVPYMT